MPIVMVETRGYTLEEVAMAFDPDTTSFADARLMGEEQGDMGSPSRKGRDVEDQK
jgi:SP family sugar:H+ symporter-like MFS transporter